jgi:serine/threonine protein kinase
MYIVQEFCDGGSLADALEQQRFDKPHTWQPPGQPLLAVSAMSPAHTRFRDICCVALNIADGMAYLHANNVLHGDLKPDNVLLVTAPFVPHGMIAKVLARGHGGPCVTGCAQGAVEVLAVLVMGPLALSCTSRN